MRNKQIIVLITDDGTASDNENLEIVWKQRIAKHFPHYRLVCAKIVSKRR